VINGARHIRKQVRVAVRVAGHQRAEFDALGLLGPGGQHGPALEMFAFRITAQRKEVVPSEDHINAGLLSRVHCPPQIDVVGVLRL
jgi:hypothetical protein